MLRPFRLVTSLNTHQHRCQNLRYSGGLKPANFFFFDLQHTENVECDESFGLPFLYLSLFWKKKKLFTKHANVFTSVGDAKTHKNIKKHFPILFYSNALNYSNSDAPNLYYCSLTQP
jgi:hypothetical protein